MDMDRRLVAFNQEHEMRYLCVKFQVKREDLKKIMIEMTGTGKPARSRADIESELKARGYSTNHIQVVYDSIEQEYIVSDGVDTTSGPTEQEAIDRLILVRLSHQNNQ
jgi:hypothetical protein